jgi:hypothetical protein
MLPSLLAKTAGADAWISAVFGSAAELILLFISLTVLELNKDKDLYGTLRGGQKGGAFRTCFAKVLILLMISIFLLQIFIILDQTFHLLNDNIFEKFPIYYFSVPILLLGIFFCFMPERAIFRSGELFFIFILFGIALSVFPAVIRIDPAEVLPAFKNGATPSFNAFYKYLIYFESAFMLLSFCGDIKIEKNFRGKFMAVAAGVSIFFVFFVFLFSSVFGPLAPIKNMAVTNLTVYSSYFTGSGRLDWVLVTIWLLLLLLRFGITFFCAYTGLRYITGIKHRAGILGTSLAVFIYCISAFVFTTSRNLDRFTSAVPWLAAGLLVVLPLIIFAVSLFEKRKDGVQNASV